MSSIRLPHHDVTSCKQRHLILKHHWCKEVSICYNHRKFGKVSSIKEGVIAFSKKVHVFLRHPVYIYIYIYIFITRKTMNNNTPHLKSPKNENRKAAYGRSTIKLLGALTSLRSTNPRPWFCLGSSDKTITMKASHCKTRAKQ